MASITKPIHPSRSSNIIEVVELETRKFILDDTVLAKVSQILLEEFQKGLSLQTDGCVRMLMTFVRKIPDGKEKGKSLVIDFKSSSFTIFCIDLFPQSTKINVQAQNFEIPHPLITGTGHELFDYIASCLNSFIELLKFKDKHFAIACSFAFPCFQTSLNKAVLLRWTKGYICSGIVGKDVGELLKEAITRKCGFTVNVISIVNNVTGTLMACAHIDKNCRIGVIIDRGTNACYLENLDNVKKWPEADKSEPRQMIINTEWGSFGDNSCINFIRTKYDMMVDNKSTNPREQVFEKMISGMYLGELVRTILVDFANYGLLFNGNVSTKLLTPYIFETTWLSLILDDVTHNRNTETEHVLKMLNINEVSDGDFAVVKMICTRILQRSAFLISAGIATILNKLKRPETTIAVDGSLYCLFPTYKTMMENKIKDLISPDYKFKLMRSKDGSGRGCALIAAAADRQDNKLK